MNAYIEADREGFTRFPQNITEYLEVKKIIFEDYMEKEVMERAVDIIGRHRNSGYKLSEITKMLKIDSIGEMIDPAIFVSQPNKGNKRRLLSFTEQIFLISEPGKLATSSSKMAWTQPYQDTRKFTRFEANVSHLDPVGRTTGSMDLFFDIPNEGSDRYQLLVAYNGYLPKIQEKPFDYFTVGGTFDQAGWRLNQGAYNYT